MEDISLREETFRRLRDTIYEESGIFIPDSKKYLVEKKLAPRVRARGLAGFDEYLELLKCRKGEELCHLFDAITTNETSFFREPEHFDVLVGNVLPELLGRGAKSVSVWSSACSSGEEPYTMAMIFREKHPLLKVSLYASDISNHILEAAKRGLYNTYSLRNTPESYLRKYFKNRGENGNQAYELAPEIRSSVKFMNLNLADGPESRFPSGMDVIFCRNVLIYFDAGSKRKAVSSLYDSLKPGGYLFIGKSESLHDVTRAFKPLIFNNTLVYQRTA